MFEETEYLQHEIPDEVTIAEFLKRVDNGSLSFERAFRNIWREHGHDYVYRNVLWQFTFTDYDDAEIIIPANPLRMGVLLLPAYPNPGVSAEWFYNSPIAFSDAAGAYHYGVQLGFGSIDFGYGVFGYSFTAGVVGVDDIWAVFPFIGGPPFPFPSTVFAYELTAQPC